MLLPRYYQNLAIESFWNYISNNWGKNPLIIVPTGAGKSLIQAYIVRKMLDYEHTRILLLTHQSELIKQNYLELMENFNNETMIDAGIYSAGLDCRDTQNRIIFAGIQSVHKRAWEMGWFDLILVDECHLIPHSGEGMYRTFLQEMKKINKNIVVGGLTATAYRSKNGLLTDGKGKLFDEVCYEATIKELINPNHPKNLDKVQYLCNLISKNAVNKVDLTNVHIRAGEYKSDEMEHAYMDNDLVGKAIKEIQEYTTDRKKVLIFSAGIKHCIDIVEKMNLMGLEARGIHSKQSDEINDQNLQAFKDGKIKYLINVNVLTTGFNEKAIDCIVLLRSTKSPGLYYQMVGRGLRLHPDKTDCLVLDFGRNIELHGPIDLIEIAKRKDGSNHIETCPMKECPECQHLLFLSVMVCPDCGYEFPQAPKHEEKASDADILSKWKKPEEVEIQSVYYSRHSKTGKPDSLRVDYYYGMIDKYSEWICLQHEGFAKRKAMQWIRKVTDLNIDTVDEALEHCSEFKQPSKIIVDNNSKYPAVVGYLFEEKKEEVISQNIPEKTFDEMLMDIL
jgi:DNA repair protein RadD